MGKTGIKITLPDLCEELILAGRLAFVVMGGGFSMEPGHACIMGNMEPGGTRMHYRLGILSLCD